MAVVLIGDCHSRYQPLCCTYRVKIIEATKRTCDSPVTFLQAQGDKAIADSIRGALMKVYRKMERARAARGAASWSRRDSGQMTIVVALAMGTFLLGFVGFGADMPNPLLYLAPAITSM